MFLQILLALQSNINDFVSLQHISFFEKMKVAVYLKKQRNLSNKKICFEP